MRTDGVIKDVVSVRFNLHLKRPLVRKDLEDYIASAILDMQYSLRPPGAVDEDDEGDDLFGAITTVESVIVKQVRS